MSGGRWASRSSAPVLLIVDDSAQVVEALAAAMGSPRYGYDVHTATTAREALGRGQALGEKLELLVMDLVLGRQSGEPTARLIEEVCPSCRTIFMTGHELPAERVAGIGHCLRKPFSNDQLDAQLRLLLAGGNGS